MRATTQTEQRDESRTFGMVISALMRMGTSRSRRVAAVIAVALLTLNQCAGLAYAEATRTVVYLDAPTVSEERASAAGKIAEEYALSIPEPDPEILNGLAIATDQRMQTVEVAYLPDETRKAFGTILSEDKDAEITADSALGAGETMLAQLEDQQSEDDGEQELASSDAVRPQLGEAEPPEPELEGEASSPEIASVPAVSENQGYGPTDTGESGASLVVEQPPQETPATVGESIEYASASPEIPGETAPVEADTEEEYGVEGPLTDTVPVEAAPVETTQDVVEGTPSELLESDESTQESSELPVPAATEIQQPEIETETHQPGTEPETPNSISVPESEAATQTIIVTEVTEPSEDESEIPSASPTSTSLDEEIPIEPEVLSVYPSDSEGSPSEAVEDEDADSEDPAQLEEENTENPALTDTPDTYSGSDTETSVQNEVEPDVPPGNGVEDSEPQDAASVNPMPASASQEASPVVSTQGRRNSENPRRNVEMPANQGANNDRKGQRLGEYRERWRQDIPELNSGDVDVWGSQENVPVSEPLPSWADPPLPEAEIPLTAMQPQVNQQTGYTQATEISQKVYEADVSGFPATPVPPTLTVDQTLPTTTSFEQSESPQVVQQIEHVEERVASFDAEVGG